MRLVTRTSRIFLAIAVIATGALAACGKSDDDVPAASGGTVNVMGIDFPRPEKTSIKLGVSSLTVGSLPTHLIDYADLGKQFGIDIKVNDFSGDAPTRQALVAGQIDVADMSGGAAISSQKTGNPFRIAYVSLDRLTDLLAGGKGITDANSLRGKAVAVSSFGSQSYAGALLALKSLGLTKDDVTITPVGNDAARLSALKAGSVGASIVDAVQKDSLSDLGFNMLANLGELDVAGYVGGSLTLTTKFIDKYPNTALALTAIFQLARWSTYSDPDNAAKAWAKIAEIPDDQALTEVKERNEVQRPLDGRCRLDVMDFMKEVATVTDASLKSVDAHAACDNDMVDKLKELGFQKKLGIPGY